MSSPTSQRTHNSTPESEPTHEPTRATTPTKGAAPEKSSSDDNLHVKKDFAAPEGDEVKGRRGKELEEGEEEEAICGFRLFWKDQRFKDCVEESLEKADEEEEEVVKEINRAHVHQEEVVKCFDITTVLKRCMRAHPDYRGPLLQAEKAARREEDAAARKK